MIDLSLAGGVIAFNLIPSQVLARSGDYATIFFGWQVVDKIRFIAESADPPDFSGYSSLLAEDG